METHAVENIPFLADLHPWLNNSMKSRTRWAKEACSIAVPE